MILLLLQLLAYKYPAHQWVKCLPMGQCPVGSYKEREWPHRDSAIRLKYLVTTSQKNKKYKPKNPPKPKQPSPVPPPKTPTFSCQFQMHKYLPWPISDNQHNVTEQSCEGMCNSLPLYRIFTIVIDKEAQEHRNE